MTLRRSARGVASAALAAALFNSTAHSQALIQAGPTTAGHVPQYFTQGTSQAVVGDGGGAGGGVLNANPSEFGITSRGSTLPVVGGGNGPEGEHFCMYDAPTVNVGGYHALCFDPNSPISGGALLSYGAYGGATPAAFDFYVNGTLVSLAGLVGTITVGTTNIAGGTSGDLIYNNSGKVGDLPLGAGVSTMLGLQPNVTGGSALYPVVASTLSGTIPVNKGGTGLTTLQTNLVLIGNGTGAVNFAATSGNHTLLASAAGTPTTGNCAQWNNGDLIDAGSSCGSGGGGSGTVTAGNAGQLAAYAASGTTVSGVNSITFKQGGLACDTLENHGGSTTTSATTNTSAWNAFVIALGSTGGCLQLGPGTYQFSTGLTVGTVPIGIFGLGVRSTILKWPNGGGIIYTPTNLTVAMVARDFTMISGDTAGGSSAIFVSVNATSGVGTKSTFTNIETSGDGAGGFWAWGYDIKNAAGVDIVSPSINGLGSVAPAGGGVLCQGAAPSSTTGYTTGLTVTNPLVTGATVAFQYDSYCQGMTVQNMNVSGGTTGVFNPTGASGTLSGLEINGGSVNVTGSAVQLGTAITGVLVQQLNVAVAATQKGIDLGPVNGGSAIGNFITCGSASLTSGISLSGIRTVMTGNKVQSCGTGISLLSPAGADYVQSNVLVLNTNNVVNSSASVVNAGSCAGVSGACVAGATP